MTNATSSPVSADSPRTAPLVVVPWVGPSPEAAFAAIATRAGVFWLDSSMVSLGAGQFSIVGCEPFARFKSWGRRYSFAIEGVEIDTGCGDPLAQFEHRQQEYRVEPARDQAVPFCGGAVGFFAYDLGRIIEPAAGDGSDEGQTPDINFAWYDAALVWDHAADAGWLVGAGWRRSPEAAIGELAGWLRDAVAPPVVSVPPEREKKFRSNMTRAAFQEAVGEARERIAAGEIYQVNLAQCFRGTISETPMEVYRRLRQLNPAPMAAYVDAGDGTMLLSSSPERFIVVDCGSIRTFPIKGTRPRGKTPTEDAAQCAELLASGKERAELLMIVDLMRNDLGRVCRFGSVQVRRLHALESFATVHHLVGEVEGELRPEVKIAELLRAIFPGGSITGAPKVRAMQMIGELEPGRRGVFSGAIGYLSACGRIDLNIAIRTIVCRGGEASFHVGAGIVWESDAAAEYEETIAKGRALFAALGVREGGEP